MRLEAGLDGPAQAPDHALDQARAGPSTFDGLLGLERRRALTARFHPMDHKRIVLDVPVHVDLAIILREAIDEPEESSPEHDDPFL